MRGVFSCIFVYARKYFQINAHVLNLTFRFTNVMHVDLDEAIVSLVSSQTLHSLVGNYTRHERRLSLRFEAAKMQLSCDETGTCHEYLRFARFPLFRQREKVFKNIVSTRVSKVYVHRAKTTTCRIDPSIAVRLHWRVNTDSHKATNLADNMKVTIQPWKNRLEQSSKMVWATVFDSS